MNFVTKHRSFINNTIRILVLVILLGSSGKALAAPSRSDVSITITADRSEVRVGQTVTYTARMTNHGPDDAYFVDASFVWPDQYTFVSMACDQGISPDTPACEYSILKAGETLVSTYVATPDPTAHFHNKVVKVTVQVFFETTDTVDPRLRNNTASVTTRILDKHGDR